MIQKRVDERREYRHDNQQARHRKVPGFFVAMNPSGFAVVATTETGPKEPFGAKRVSFSTCV